jgi:hypothetical protein
LGVCALACSGYARFQGDNRWFFTGLVVAAVIFLAALSSYVYEKD